MYSLKARGSNMHSFVTCSCLLLQLEDPIPNLEALESQGESESGSEGGSEGGRGSDNFIEYVIYIPLHTNYYGQVLTVAILSLRILLTPT